MLGFIVALAVQSTSIGDFGYVYKPDPMNDAATMGAVLSGDDMDVVFACDHNRSKTIFAQIQTKRVLNYSTNSLLNALRPLEYRIDSNESVLELVEYGVDTIDLQGAVARALAERLSNGSRLTVRVDGVSGTITNAFEAKGAREAIRRLAQDCGDKRLIQRLDRGSKK